MLTPRQLDALRAIQDSKDRRGYPPTGKELGAVLGVSTARGGQLIAALAKAGCLEVTPLVSRGLLVTEKGYRVLGMSVQHVKQLDPGEAERLAGGKWAL